MQALVNTIEVVKQKYFRGIKSLQTGTEVVSEYAFPAPFSSVGEK